MHDQELTADRIDTDGLIAIMAAICGQRCHSEYDDHLPNCGCSTWCRLHCVYCARARAAMSEGDALAFA